jgi:hypothetical protein
MYRLILILLILFRCRFYFSVFLTRQNWREFPKNRQKVHMKNRLRITSVEMSQWNLSSKCSPDRLSGSGFRWISLSYSISGDLFLNIWKKNSEIVSHNFSSILLTAHWSQLLSSPIPRLKQIFNSTWNYQIRKNFCQKIINTYVRTSEIKKFWFQRMSLWSIL